MDRVAELVAHLVAARQRVGMSQRDVSHVCYTSQAMIARLERGTIDPSLRLLGAYAEAVGCPITWTLGADPPRQ